MTVSAILTAAGESTRMGRPKPLLAWPSGRGGDVALVEYQVSQLVCAGVDQVVVVVGFRGDEVASLARAAGAATVDNPDYAAGKTTSIRAGLGAVDAGAGAIVLLAVDQPRAASIIRAVIDAHLAGGAAVTSPRHRGRGGHPIAFDARLGPELAAITEEGQGIREVIARHAGRAHRVEIDDPAVRLDLNTPAEYRRAYAAEAARAAP